MPSKSTLNYPIMLTTLLFFSFLLLILFSTIQFSSSLPSANDPMIKSGPDPFTNLLVAFRKWDAQVDCPRFKEKYHNWAGNGSGSFQMGGYSGGCGGEESRPKHVSVLVKGWTWVPDNMDSLYSCGCGLSCLWTKSSVLADSPDALLFETTTPPLQRRMGEPLRVYMDLEPGRRRSGREDIFVSYHAKDDVQSTYAGSFFHNNRNYYVSSQKNNDVLMYWSSSRCLVERNELAKKILGLVPTHSFGKCLNNVGGLDKGLTMYPPCVKDSSSSPKWWDHLHCVMSHYKFALAIENTMTESYVTEKLFYALDSGAVPIYFGAPNVMDFVPPHSIIDGSKFGSIEELASYVKALADDPVAYAEYHAWRRCGVVGNYGMTRATSLDTLPCRLCDAVSKRGGRNAKAL
ncbi:hypothetical protein RND81_06G047500 [Saponaria officinalis]|uniref:Fucosyltransferase n=1 Tax=Saponaria officinalis TaxID=3572 RepID=A0AAW1K7Y1_SAPOF